MKVGIVNYSNSFGPGGINRFVLGLAKSLVKKGIRVTVIEPASDETTMEESGEFQIERISVPRFKPPFNLSRKFSLELISWIEREKPDVVHVNGYMHLLSHQVVRELRRSTATKIVFSPHYDVSISTRAVAFLLPLFHRTVGKKTAEKCDSLAFVSGFESAAFSKEVLRTEKNGRVIPIGLEWRPEESIVKFDKEIKMLYCGHIIRRKRVDRAIRLLYEIKSRAPGIEATLRIIGEGPERKKLEKLATKVGVDDSIEWKDFVTREMLLEEIKKTDIFVLLSDSEAFAITVAESLSLGTMALLSDNTALSEFSPVEGVLLAKDPDDFGEIAKRVLELRDREIKIGSFGQKVVSWEDVSESYLELYKELI